MNRRSRVGRPGSPFTRIDSETPPAAAVLNGGGDRRFELSFDSYNSLSGGFFKGTDRVCDVTATKS